MFTAEDDMEGTGPVRDGQAIDADRVAGWLGRSPLASSRAGSRTRPIS